MMENNKYHETDKWAVVLLVDNDKLTAESVRKLISKESDIEFHYCADSKRAVQQATEIRATVILQDLFMPDIDGLTLVRFYRNNPATKNIPIIVLSSKDDPNIKSDAFNHGATDYLIKLPEKVELLARIRSHARSYLAQKERDQAFNALSKMQTQLETMNEELARSSKELMKANKELERLSLLDDLTNIANRRHFDQVFHDEWASSQETGNPLSILMADMDDLKSFNDSYGHPAGSECLKALALALDNCELADNSLVARYGGDEFVVLLPNTTLEEAITYSRSIQTSIKELKISHTRSAASNFVTVSIGVASQSRSSDKPSSLLIESADNALFKAKGLGKNRIEAEKSAKKGR